MRPRHYTAENQQWVAVPSRSVASFNEAAALHRGKHIAAALPGQLGGASMRPRHYTAENDVQRAFLAYAERGFNEAAALHRGKQVGLLRFNTPE